MKITSEQYKKMAIAIRFLDNPHKIEAAHSCLRGDAAGRPDRLRVLVHTIEGFRLRNLHRESPEYLPEAISIDFRGVRMVCFKPRSSSGGYMSNPKAVVDVEFSPSLTPEALEVAQEVAEAQVARLVELRDLIKDLPEPDLSGMLVAHGQRARTDNKDWPQPAPWDLIKSR